MRVVKQLADTRPAVVAFVAQGLLSGTVAALVPGFVELTNPSDTQLGIAFLISAAGGVIGMLVAPLVDRWLSAYSMSMTTCLAALLLLIPGLLTSIWWLAATFFFISFWIGQSDVLSNARVSEVEARREQPLMAMTWSFYSFSYAVAAFMAGLARAAGYSTFSILFGICVLMLALSLWMRAEPSNTILDDEAGGSRLGIVFAMVSAIIFIEFLAGQPIGDWSALFIERDLGGDPGEGSYAPALAALANGIVLLTGNWLAQRIRSIIVLATAATAAAISLAIAATASAPIQAYVGFTMASLSLALISPFALTILGQYVSDNHRVFAITRASAIGNIAYVVGPILIGFTSDGINLASAFLGVAGLTMLIPCILIPGIALRTKTLPLQG